MLFWRNYFFLTVHLTFHPNVVVINVAQKKQAEVSVSMQIWQMPRLEYIIGSSVCTTGALLSSHVDSCKFVNRLVDYWIGILPQINLKNVMQLGVSALVSMAVIQLAIYQWSFVKIEFVATTLKSKCPQLDIELFSLQLSVCISIEPCRSFKNS